MSNRRIQSIEERREFVQEIIDRLLYLDSDNREKFISSIQSSIKRFKPPVVITDDSNGTRVYKPIHS